MLELAELMMSTNVRLAVRLRMEEKSLLTANREHLLKLLDEVQITTFRSRTEL